MQQSRLERFAPLAGVLTIALVVAAIIVFPEETPASDDAVADVVRFWRDHDDAASVSAVLGALAAVPYMWFIGSLRAALRESEPPPGRLSALAFAGGILFAGALAVSTSLQFVLGESANDLSPAAIQALNALNAQFFFPFLVGVAVLMFASAVAILRYRGLHVAFGWTALIIGIVAVTPAGFFGFAASALWILAASIYLYVRGARGTAAPPPAVPAPPGPPS